MAECEEHTVTFCLRTKGSASHGEQFIDSMLPMVNNFISCGVQYIAPFVCGWGFLKFCRGVAVYCDLICFFLAHTTLAMSDLASGLGLDACARKEPYSMV